MAQRLKHLPAMWETRVRSLGREDSRGEGNGNPLQYSCLENPMDGGAWWATIHGVAKSRTRLNDCTFTLLLPPDISTTVFHFHFGPAASFFLEVLVIVLHSSSVAYWTPSNPGGSTFSVISFCLFIQFMGFLWPEYWSGLPFPPPVDHILWELSTMTHPFCVALQGMTHSFIELCKPLRQNKAVIHEGDSVYKLSN